MSSGAGPEFETAVAALRQQAARSAPVAGASISTKKRAIRADFGLRQAAALRRDHRSHGPAARRSSRRSGHAVRQFWLVANQPHFQCVEPGAFLFRAPKRRPPPPSAPRGADRKAETAS